MPKLVPKIVKLAPPDRGQFDTVPLMVEIQPLNEVIRGRAKFTNAAAGDCKLFVATTTDWKNPTPGPAIQLSCVNKVLSRIITDSQAVPCTVTTAGNGPNPVPKTVIENPPVVGQLIIELPLDTHADEVTLEIDGRLGKLSANKKERKRDKR